MMHGVISSDLPFSQAAGLWVESKTFNGPRGRYISPRTLADYGQYIVALNRFFKDLPLRDIHIGHIREYERLRACGELGPKLPKGKSPRPVGPNKIIQEVGTLIQVMRRAHCWTPELDELYRPLQREEHDIPRALSIAEQDSWLSMAASRARWEAVHCYSILGFQTTMRECELRKLRLGDIYHADAYVMVRSGSAKNKNSIRTIPLSDEALWAAGRMMERAKRLGASSPTHYLFPYRMKRNCFDPSRPMSESGISKQWQEVRDATGLSWFRMYDTRHTGLTRMAEAGVAEAVRSAFSGHQGRRMREHYEHICEQAKRQAVAKAFPRRTPIKISEKYA